uniref:Protein FAM26F-like n=1 Tax=Saccoglossus kowalevskii TaxID=10224 RepID=A0ABM0MG11_SACKO|nr:PREDICTED: protein FAM26F-like [Saccoglossus kowalevskii]
MAMKGILDRLATLVKENQTSLQNIAMILAIFGVTSNKTNLIIGVAISNKTWKLVSGCCRAPGGILDFCRPRYTCYGGCCGLVQVTAQATVAALVWIFIALMNGSYFACGISTIECKNNETTPVLNDNDRAMSQTIGLAMLSVTSGLILILMFIWRMCSTFTFEHKRYANIYNDIEKEEFVKKSKEIARVNIQKTLDKFFGQEKLKCNDARSWGQVQNAWSKISFVGSEYAADYGYTPLHEWAIDEQENNNTENQEEPAQFNLGYGNSTMDTTENKEETFEMRVVPNVST